MKRPVGGKKLWIAFFLANLSLPVRAEVAVETRIEGSQGYPVEKQGEGHFAVRFQRTPHGFHNWFFLKVTGAAGKAVRITLLNATRGKAWKTLNPVIYEGPDPGELTAFDYRLPRTPLPPRKLPNGAFAADDSLQKWKFIAETELAAPDFSFTVHPQTDCAWVAMRYPYTPTLNARFCESAGKVLATRMGELLKLCETPGKRPLYLLKIAEPSGLPEAARPTALVYAREHATEQDGSWVCAGAVQFLLSNDTQATAIRQQMVWLVIPMLDPDGAAEGLFAHLTDSFAHGWATPETLAVGEWFQSWVNSGKRLDLALDCHNVESNGVPHLVSPQMEPERGRFADGERFHRTLRKLCPDYAVAQKCWGRGYSYFRLAGWLGDSFGALPLYYELNAQAPARHLSLAELLELGRRITLAGWQFLREEKSQKMLADIARFRREHAVRWKRYGEEVRGHDVFAQELLLSVLPTLSAQATSPAP